MSGTKSGDRKRGAIVKLLARAKREEAGYVMRALQVGVWPAREVDVGLLPELGGVMSGTAEPLAAGAG